jgi:hypothetical protein
VTKKLSETVTLKSPVEFNGQTYTEVTFRRPNGLNLSVAGSLMKKSKDDEDGVLDMKALHRLMQEVANVPSEVIDMADVDDYPDLQVAVTNFLPKTADSKPSTDTGT